MIDKNNSVSLAYQGVEREYQFVRNFSPVDVIPRTHHIVQEIEEKLKPFVYSSGF